MIMRIINCFEEEIEIKDALVDSIESDSYDQISSLQESVSNLINVCVILSEILIKNNLMSNEQLRKILDAKYRIGE